jgi:hypothetical protein
MVDASGVLSAITTSQTFACLPARLALLPTSPAASVVAMHLAVNAKETLPIARPVSTPPSSFRRDYASPVVPTKHISAAQRASAVVLPAPAALPTHAFLASQTTIFSIIYATQTATISAVSTIYPARPVCSAPTDVILVQGQSARLACQSILSRVLVRNA